MRIDEEFMEIWPNEVCDMEAEEPKVLIRKASGFFVANGQLWKKDSRAKHKLVIDEELTKASP